MSAPATLTPGLIAIVERALGDVLALLREEMRREVEHQMQVALVLAEVAQSRGLAPLDAVVPPAPAEPVSMPAAADDLASLRAEAAPSLLTDIETFLAATGMGHSTLGKNSIGDGRLVHNMRKGRKVGALNEQRVRKYMRAHALKARDAKAPNSGAGAPKITVADNATAEGPGSDDTKPAGESGCEGQAADVTSGAAIGGALIPAEPKSSPLGDNACQSPQPPTPLSSAPADADDDDDVRSEFEAALGRVQDKAVEVRQAPPIDTARVAAAFERKAKAARVQLPATRVPRFQGMRWCDQCQLRKAWAQAESCKSKFCKVEA